MFHGPHFVINGGLLWLLAGGPSVLGLAAQILGWNHLAKACFIVLICISLIGLVGKARSQYLRFHTGYSQYEQQ